MCMFHHHLYITPPVLSHRVDKGFVAQVADVIGGRQGAKLNKAQQVEAEKKVPLEVKADVKHTEGVFMWAWLDSAMPSAVRTEKKSFIGA